jgi:hypothetical protein
MRRSTGMIPQLPYGSPLRHGWQALTLVAAISASVPQTSFGDGSLKTPYVMLDPSSIPPPAAMGKALPSAPGNPTETRRLPADLGIPRIVSNRTTEAVPLTLSNAAVSMRVTIGVSGQATIDGIRNNLTGEELLSGASQVFHIAGKSPVSSDAFKVARWDAYQYPDYAELVATFESDKAAPVTWRARVFRTRPWIEQDLETQLGDAVLGQVLSVRPSLQPIMPANLFGRGFTGGKPNIPDRHRFEIVAESDHVCYDAQTQTGIWGFVAETGGQERIAEGRFALIQNPSFRTRRSGRLGPFILQPFQGPVELGFMGLRRYLQKHYAVQADTPSLYEWNQFWLWQGGPTRVDKRVVTWQRLLDVLPRQVKMGMEEFHLDDGWQWHDGDWQIGPDRFPGGWPALRDFNRANGLAFHLWVNDGTTNSADFILDLIKQSNIYRLFMDRMVTEKTVEAVEKVRTRYPGFSTSCHNSTSRSAYWSWGNLHFLSDFNQIYFGEGQFWAWSNILPEAAIEPKADPLFPQRTEAERFFSRHDLYTGDLITRSAAYQAQWVWPFNCIFPPHNGWIWFEHRPIEQLRSRIYTYLAARFNYQWGFDPVMLSRDALDLHLACTAWFKANREFLTGYQHVLDAPDGRGIDAAGHLVDGHGFIFLFNPSDKEQAVPWRQLLWEPELELAGESVRLSDWTDMTAYQPLDQQMLASPKGEIKLGARAVKVLGINLDDAEVLARVRIQRAKIGYP